MLRCRVQRHTVKKVSTRTPCLLQSARTHRSSHHPPASLLRRAPHVIILRIREHHPPRQVLTYQWQAPSVQGRWTPSPPLPLWHRSRRPSRPARLPSCPLGPKAWPQRPAPLALGRWTPSPPLPLWHRSRRPSRPARLPSSSQGPMAQLKRPSLLMKFPSTLPLRRRCWASRQHCCLYRSYSEGSRYSTSSQRPRSSEQRGATPRRPWPALSPSVQPAGPGHRRPGPTGACADRA
mmetsp:Transcript_104035/g.275052  ORF Transcript_104035/g.275052 Transcript_104035/m.275052 type:complete len:235 (-) Transcript_104035:1000-1704(-)